MAERLALTALLLLLAGCGGPALRPTLHLPGEGYAAIGRSSVVGGERGEGVVRPDGSWLLEPVYDHVVVLSSRCVLTRARGAETYERWPVTWDDGVASVGAATPTPWRSVEPLLGAEAADPYTPARYVEEAKAGERYLTLASPTRVDVDTPEHEAVPLALLGDDGEPLAYFQGFASWRATTIRRPFLRGQTVFAAGPHTTELLGLDGRRRLPPLPNLGWPGGEPALELPAELVGRAGLYWPLDEETSLPVDDPTRSVIGWEPVVMDPTNQPRLVGWIKHYRTPDGPRVGLCSKWREADQGPVAARAVQRAKGCYYPQLALELPGGGWVLDELRPREGGGIGGLSAALRAERVLDEPAASPEAAFATYDRRTAEETARREAERRAREAEERASRLSSFAELMAEPEPNRPRLEALTLECGPVQVMEYVRRHRPTGLDYLRAAIELLEGPYYLVDAADLALVRARYATCKAEQERRAAEAAAAHEREQAERRRIRREEERQQAERDAAAAAAHAEELARNAPIEWDLSGPREDPGARARRVSESLFRQTYGQQDWRWGD